MLVLNLICHVLSIEAILTKVSSELKGTLKLFCLYNNTRAVSWSAINYCL